MVTPENRGLGGRTMISAGVVRQDESPAAAGGECWTRVRRIAQCAGGPSGRGRG
jgi:hypothetical protein